MGRAILYIATSLDGLVAGPGDDISWLFRYNDVDYGFGEFFADVGAIIQGRRAYDIEIERGWENAHPVPTFVPLTTLQNVGPAATTLSQVAPSDAV